MVGTIVPIVRGQLRQLSRPKLNVVKLNVVIDGHALNQYLAALMGQQLRPRVKRKARIRRIKRLKQRKAEAKKTKASAKTA